MPVDCPPVYQGPLGEHVWRKKLILGESLFRYTPRKTFFPYSLPPFRPPYNLPLFRNRGPELLAGVLELAPSASFDTPTTWLPYPATGAPLGGLLVGYCTAVTPQQRTGSGTGEKRGSVCACFKQFDYRTVPQWKCGGSSRRYDVEY